MVDRSFLLQIGLTVLVVSGIAGFLLLRFGTEEMVVGAAAGTAMAVLNAVAGTLAAGYAFDKSHTRFLTIVLGGMGIRMAVMLIALFVLIRFAGLHVVSLATALFGLYLVFLVMEILSLQRLVERRR